MKNYRDMTESVLQKSAEIIERRQRNRRRAAAAGSSACFLLAAALGITLLLSENRSPSIAPPSAAQSEETPLSADNSSAAQNSPEEGQPTSGNGVSKEYSPTESDVGGIDRPVTLVRSFGTGAAGASYRSPENGETLFSVPLSDAFEAYADNDENGRAILYYVTVDVFSGGERLSPETAEKFFIDPEKKTEYRVALEKSVNGTEEVIELSLVSTERQLKDFPVKNEYGYRFALRDEKQ